MKFRAIDNGPVMMSVRSRCDALGVTEQGYYHYLQRRDAVTKHAQRDEELAAEIVAADKEGRGTYGSPRLQTALRRNNTYTSRRRIDRIRDNLGLSVVSKTKWVRTTDSRNSKAPSPNLLNRQFVATAPNTVWVSDITYLTAGNDWLYLCTIIDCFGGTIVGRQLSQSIDARLVQDALAKAVRDRRPAPGCLFHSDRGSQYESAALRADLAKHQFEQSMSRLGNCWDNAVAESSFARLKSEIGDIFIDIHHATKVVYEYIDIFYNLIRIHTRHNMAPIEFERNYLITA